MLVAVDGGPWPLANKQAEMSPRSYKWADPKIKSWAHRNGLGARRLAVAVSASSRKCVSNRIK